MLKGMMTARTDWAKKGNDAKQPKLTTFYWKGERLSHWLSLARELASYFGPGKFTGFAPRESLWGS